MIGLEVLIGVVLLLCIYILFAPFYIEVNSDTNMYRVRFHRVATARIYLTNETILLELKIFWWHKILDLFSMKKTPKKAKEVEQKTKKGKKGISFRKVLAIVRSFKLNQCHVSLNTNDMVLNGLLYSWFWWAGKHFRKDIAINFQNDTVIVLEIKNNVARILGAYLY